MCMFISTQPVGADLREADPWDTVLAPLLQFPGTAHDGRQPMMTGPVPGCLPLTQEPPVEFWAPGSSPGCCTESANGRSLCTQDLYICICKFSSIKKQGPICGLVGCEAASYTDR